MGVPVNVAVVLWEWLHRAGGGDTLLSLGVQALDFDAGAFVAATGDTRFTGHAPSLFEACGFRHSRALDVSAFEGADVLFDLNEQETPADLVGRFDAVFNGGTLEHVFHLPNALSHMTRMLRPSGVAIHLSPCHNWVDHGFYQFGPTLFFDYYEAAGFIALESAMFLFDVGSDEPWTVMPAPPEAFGAGLSGTFDRRTALHLFMARKTVEARDHAIPVQSLYRSDTRRPRAQSRWFAPCSMRNGVVVAKENYVERRLGRFVHDAGLCWVCDVSDWSDAADDADHPVRSQVVLMEDGARLGPAHSRHDQIRAHGAGRYSHWSRAIYFSTADGSNPNDNGRHYTALAPAGVD